MTVYLSGLDALRGLVFFQVGTAFVVPTDGQVYDPTDGALVVPRQYGPGCARGCASAAALERANAVATTIVVSFMVVSFLVVM